MGDEFGVLYVATKEDRYLDEACESSRSLRRHCPDVPATLFTNLPEKLGARADLFERVIPIESATGFAWSWAEGQLDRLRCLQRSPYRRTLQLDTDTRVDSPRLAEVSDLLAEHDVVVNAADPETSRSCALFGPMYHLAAFGYRHSDKSDRLFADLIALAEESFALGSAAVPKPPPFLSHITDPRPEDLRQLLMSDQVSLARLLSPSTNRHDLSVHLLPPEWLAQVQSAADPPAGTVISHGEAFKQRDPNSVNYSDQFSVVFPAHLLWRRFERVDALNRALARHCLKQCEGPAEANKASLGGRRSTGNFFSDAEPAVRTLKQMVDDTVLRYLRDAVPALLPSGTGDMAVLIDGWAYVLEAGDMLATHLHRDGFVTGTYYVELPDLGEDDDGKQGRLVLQHPSAAASMIDAPQPLVDRRTIDARAGDMVLFPSFLQHHVNPVRRGRRIAVSFDVALRPRQTPDGPPPA